MHQHDTTTVHDMSAASRIGCGLRDFFIASSGTEMKQAYLGLRSVCPELPAAESADTIEFAFNRLFVGPKTPVAPPFASVYLEKDELVMGRTTLDARDLYTSLGLTSPWLDIFPDDHLSLEIDACLHLRQLLPLAENQEIAALYQHFLQDHLLEWIPQFRTCIASAEGVPASIEAVTWLMIDWLRQELTSATQKGEQE